MHICIKAAFVQPQVSFPFALYLLSIDLIHDFGPTISYWKKVIKNLRMFVANKYTAQQQPQPQQQNYHTVVG